MTKPLFLLLLVFSLYSRAEKADFINNDWQKARAQAKEQGKYLFVDAYTDWCYWCKVMDKQTFSQQSVTDYMGKNFVLLKMEMEHDYGKTVAMKYRVNSFPTYLIFNPEGKLVYRVSGYLEAKPFMEKLNAALDPAKQQTYAGISDKMELDYPDFYIQAHGEKGKRVSPDSLTLLSYFNTQQDLYSEVNYAVIEQFASILPTKYKDFFLNHRSKYAGLFGKEAVDNVVYTYAYNKLKDAIRDSSETQLNSTLNFVDAYINPEDKEETKSGFSINFYQSLSNWTKLGEKVDQYIKANGYANDQSINGWSWTIYEKANDNAIVEKALGWMKPVIESKPKYYSMDTYAALLYKAKKIKLAETYALKAIELGKKEGEKTESTEALLEKIKKEK